LIAFFAAAVWNISIACYGTIIGEPYVRPAYLDVKIAKADFRDEPFLNCLKYALDAMRKASDEPVEMLWVCEGSHYLGSEIDQISSLNCFSNLAPVTISIRDMSVLECIQYTSEMSGFDLHLYNEPGLLIFSDKPIQNRDPYIAKYSPSAPTLFITCEHCKSYILGMRKLYSGNTMGAIWWTDGKREAPMLPDTNWLMKCPYCKDLFWPELFVPIATPRTTPDEEDYFLYLSQSCPDSAEKELYVRIRAWWAYNDKYRTGTNPYDAMWDLQQENLQELLGLLSVSNEHERIQSAEIHRELGDFDKAMELLDFEFSEDYSSGADQIRDLSKRKVSGVRQLKAEE
jgi:hypothetical protein